jgi:hypothetical protein
VTPAEREDARADAAQAAFEAAMAEAPDMPRRAWRAVVFSADVTRETMSDERRALVADEVERSAVRPVLTEAAARARVEEAWIAGVDDDVDQTIDRFTALLMRVAGPVTAAQASMAAAFEVVKACDVDAVNSDGGCCCGYGCPRGHGCRFVDEATCDGCRRPLCADAEEQGEAGSAVLCGACIRACQSAGDGVEIAPLGRVAWTFLEWVCSWAPTCTGVLSAWCPVHGARLCEVPKP